jgi:hypothetical protein
VVEVLRDSSERPLAPGRLGRGSMPTTGAEATVPTRSRSSTPPSWRSFALGPPRPAAFHIKRSSMTMIHHPLSRCGTATYAAARRPNSIKSAPSGFLERLEGSGRILTGARRTGVAL